MYIYLYYILLFKYRCTKVFSLQNKVNIKKWPTHDWPFSLILQLTAQLWMFTYKVSAFLQHNNAVWEGFIFRFNLQSSVFAIQFIALQEVHKVHSNDLGGKSAQI